MRKRVGDKRVGAEPRAAIVDLVNGWRVAASSKRGKLRGAKVGNPGSGNGARRLQRPCRLAKKESMLVFVGFLNHTHKKHHL